MPIIGPQEDGVRERVQSCEWSVRKLPDERALSDGRIQTGRTGIGGSRQRGPPKLPKQRETLVGPYVKYMRRQILQGI